MHRLLPMLALLVGCGNHLEIERTDGEVYGLIDDSHRCTITWDDLDEEVTAGFNAGYDDAATDCISGKFDNGLELVGRTSRSSCWATAHWLAYYEGARDCQ